MGKGYSQGAKMGDEPAMYAGGGCGRVHVGVQHRGEKLLASLDLTHSKRQKKICLSFFHFRPCSSGGPGLGPQGGPMGPHRTGRL